VEQFFNHRTGPADAHVAYFSMEIGLQADLPTYSGGLGVLAGDTIKSAADLAVPLVAVTLVHEHGFFKQRLGHDGWQTEEPEQWTLGEKLVEQPERVQIPIEGRTVHLRAWRRDVTGVHGHVVPVFFLDANLPENDGRDRVLTERLYGGDQEYRLRQEMILGVGGVRMLQALGYAQLRKYHMNEGHSAFLIVELLRQSKEQSGSYDVPMVRNCTVFTTHTPVAAGHDRFSKASVLAAWPDLPNDIEGLFDGEELNMTKLALEYAGYVNGVAKKHGEVSRHMFPGFTIDSITNGVHSVTWTSEEMQALFDQFMHGWRADSSMLRYAMSIPASKIREAHAAAKKRLIDTVNAAGGNFSPDVFTIGFARRATAYKRAFLLFSDPARLRAIAEREGGLQIVFAGKAHPKDTEGKEIIKRIFATKDSLGPSVKLIYLENYTMDLAKTLVTGVDVWLNTPLRPLEASGTSGMKAAHNGVPSLSVLDGWWIEGCLEGITGWAVGPLTDDDGIETTEHDRRDADDLYGKLEHVILPMYYNHPDQWAGVMRGAIAINASFFNTNRMIQEYVLRAYFH